MLRRLCVFLGPFGIDAAAMVCGDRAGLDGALDRLVGLGLLTVHREGTGVRHSVPRILAAYLERRADEPAERTLAEAAHLRYHAGQCRDPPIMDDDLLARIYAGYPDFLQALRTGMAGAGPDDEVHDLALALLLYWLWRDRLQPALRWLDRIAARFPDSPPRQARADVLRAAFLRDVGRTDQAADLATRAIATLAQASQTSSETAMSRTFR